MKAAFSVLLSLIIINGIIVWYEQAEQFSGWRLYFGLAGLTLLSALSLPIGLMLLIPITGYNLLVNTTRIRQKIGGNQNGGY